MLDKEDLQAIAKLLSASEERMTDQITASEERMTGKIDAAIAASEERMTGQIAASEERMTGKIDAAIIASEERMTGKIDAAIVASEERTDTKLSSMEDRIVQKTMVMMEQYFQPRFDLLAENQQMILDKLDGKVDKTDCENSMSVVAAAIRAHGRDIDELKA